MGGSGDGSGGWVRLPPLCETWLEPLTGSGLSPEPVYGVMGVWGVNQQMGALSGSHKKEKSEVCVLEHPVFIQKGQL